MRLSNLTLHGLDCLGITRNEEQKLVLKERADENIKKGWHEQPIGKSGTKGIIQKKGVRHLVSSSGTRVILIQTRKKIKERGELERLPKE